MNTKEYIEQWQNSYFNDLVNNIMPFWIDNGWDKKHGGVYTCLNRDGTLMDTTKSVWFQGRFAFTCAYAYNNIQKNPLWIEAAQSTIKFMEQYCFDSDEHMFFEVTQDGKPLRKRRYVFSETFAAIAFAEYAIATQDMSYAHKALHIFDNIQRFLSTPGFLPNKYQPEVEMRGHSIVMILINTCSRIREAIDHPKLTEQINKSISELEKYFIHPQFQALLEVVGPNGEFIDTNMGRTINPGHCIETAWFILEESEYRGWDEKLNKLALQILDWSWKWGWDDEYGGIINFRDCKNLPPQDYSQDMKFWWPQCETIIASLYAYLASQDSKYLSMHKQISDWTYQHFPDKEYPEWYGYLHRDGTVAQPAKGNIYKGPFHIPRMMIKSHLLCNKILKKL